MAHSASRSTAAATSSSRRLPPTPSSSSPTQTHAQLRHHHGRRHPPPSCCRTSPTSVPTTSTSPAPSPPPTHTSPSTPAHHLRHHHPHRLRLRLGLHLHSLGKRDLHRQLHRQLQLLQHTAVHRPHRHRQADDQPRLTLFLETEVYGQALRRNRHLQQPTAVPTGTITFITGGQTLCTLYRHTCSATTCNAAASGLSVGTYTVDVQLLRRHQLQPRRRHYSPSTSPQRLSARSSTTRLAPSDLPTRPSPAASPASLWATPSSSRTPPPPPSPAQSATTQSPPP